MKYKLTLTFIIGRLNYYSKQEFFQNNNNLLLNHTTSFDKYKTKSKNMNERKTANIFPVGV